MKTNRSVNSFLALLVLSCLLSNIAICQRTKKPAEQKIAYRSGNPSDWPKNQDAVIAASDNHKVLLENDKVRMLEVTLLPGQKEPVYHHQRPVCYTYRPPGILLIMMAMAK